MAAVAVLAALIGLVLFTGDDPAPSADEELARPRPSPTHTPAPSPTPTTTATVAPPQALEWAGGVVIGEGTPVLATALGDEWIVLATNDVDTGDAVELEGWVSQDGSTWAPLDRPAPGLRRLHRTVAAEGRLLVAGQTDDGTPTLWMSADGRTWESTQLPVEPPPPGREARFTAVTTVDGVLMAATSSDVDLRRLIADRFPELGDYLDRFGLTFGVDSTGLTVQGPLGLPLLSTSASELGFADGDPPWMTGPRGEDSMIWALTPAGTWESTSVTGIYVDSIVRDSEGGLLAAGWTPTSGPRLLLSADGSRWELADDEIQRVWRWGGDVIALNNFGQLGRRTTDGWQRIDLGDAIDDAGWYPLTIAAGDGGLGLIAQTFPSVVSEERSQQGVAILVEDGFTLRADLSDHSLSLLDPDGRIIVAADLFDESAAPGIAADLEAGTVVFSNPDTGEVLVDFTIDDLVQLERALDSAPPFQFENTIVFSADGDTWSSQTSRQIAGPTSMINHLALSQTHALAIAQDERSVFGGPPGELVAWVAPISDQ